jgi:hypothetical protein
MPAQAGIQYAVSARRPHNAHFIGRRLLDCPLSLAMTTAE